MKRQTLSTLALLASSLQQALATGWFDVTPFDCPSKGSHQCDAKQYSGFDWAELEVGVFTEYAGLEFQGYECADSFNNNKRDLIGRTFQNKCATGTATSDVSKNPKIKCGSSGPSAFNIDYFQITVEFDCDMEFHYTMGDGSTCKQKSACTTGGTIVKNSQCGGAISVSPYYPAQKGKPGSCKHGLHGIGFYCPPSSSSSKPVTYTSAQKTTTSSENSPTKTTSATSLSSVSLPPSSPPAPPTSNSYSPPAVSTTTLSSIPSVAPTTSVSYSPPAIPSTSITYSPPAVPITSVLSSPPVAPTTSSSSALSVVPPPYTPPASSPPVSTTEENSPTSSAPPSIITIVTTSTTSICPVTSTVISSGTTSLVVSQVTSTIVLTSTLTICTKCTAVPTVTSSVALIISSASSVAAVSSSTSSTPATTSTPSTSCPDLVPQCIKMWLPTNCASNADVPCFCANTDFASLACGCINSHGKDDAEIITAVAYFQGLCSSYISKNPALLTCGPSSNGTIPGPLTTVTIATIVTVPCSTATSSTLTQTLVTAITVPQVVLQTTTGAAVLVTGTTPAPYYTSSFSTATATRSATSTSATPVLFTGAASRPNVAAGLVIGAAVAVMAF